MRMFRLSLLLPALLLNDPVYGYVNGGLPRAKQIEWLREMTVDICESPPGELTHEMLQTTPQLMRGWKSACNHKNGKESALAVESLLKRVIDERRAGNPKAIATTSDYNNMLESWATSGAGPAAAEPVKEYSWECKNNIRKTVMTTSSRAWTVSRLCSWHGANRLVGKTMHLIELNECLSGWSVSTRMVTMTWQFQMLHALKLSSKHGPEVDIRMLHNKRKLYWFLWSVSTRVHN
jgi:hypothetical protein